MPSIKMYNQYGAEAGELNLDDTVFGMEYNEPLIHQVVVAQMANNRQGTKSTLTRSEVRGGGIKPWRQKGTGRARQGSIRSPQWIKGGVVFAPKPRDFSKKVNKNSKRNALVSALSEKFFTNEIIVVDEIKLVENKTKEMTAIFKALNVDKTALLVVLESDEMIVRASANLPSIKTIPANLINVYDVVKCNKCVMTKDAILKIEEAYKAL